MVIKFIFYYPFYIMKNYNVKTALLISIFWWYFWLDRFYKGDYKFWIIKLFTLWWYWIWWIIDIYLLLKKQNKDDVRNISKKIIKPIMYSLWWLLIIWIISAIIMPPSPQNNITQINSNQDIIWVDETETELKIKKDIYYIYWQTEHIASLLTIKKFWDFKEEDKEKRDNFFKNTKIEYEEKLINEKWIDLKIYTKNAIEIWYWEWEKNNWEKPTSEDNSVLEYVYWEEWINLIKATNEFLNNKSILNKKYSSCIWLASMNYPNWVLWPIQSAIPKKINDTHINIETYITLWQIKTENINCMYEYNEKSKSYWIIWIEN